MPHLYNTYTPVGLGGGDKMSTVVLWDILTAGEQRLIETGKRGLHDYGKAVVAEAVGVRPELRPMFSEGKPLPVADWVQSARAKGGQERRG